jgi:hypothetical protein
MHEAWDWWARALRELGLRELPLREVFGDAIVEMARLVMTSRLDPCEFGHWLYGEMDRLDYTPEPADLSNDADLSIGSDLWIETRVCDEPEYRTVAQARIRDFARQIVGISRQR